MLTSNNLAIYYHRIKNYDEMKKYYLMAIENIKPEDYILVVASAPIPGDEIDPQYVIAHDIVGHTIDSPIHTNGLEENILKYI